MLLDRPPLNLLRQELAGTCVYLDILQKTTSILDVEQGKVREPSINENGVASGTALAEHTEDNKLQVIAEGKLVSFCRQVLSEASDFQLNMGETANMDIHRVLELRSPIVVKVLNMPCWILSCFLFSCTKR